MVTLRVEMHDAQGGVLDAPEAPVSYLHGGYGGLLEGLERALDGLQPGAEVRLQLEPEQAFGDYDAELVRLEPVERYGGGLEVGMEVEEGEQVYLVTDIAGGQAVLDGNHPLAGMALRFFMKVLDVRAATPDEVKQGAIAR